MQKQAFLGLLIFTFFSCVNKLEVVEIKGTDGVLLEKYTKNKKTGMKTGKYEKFSPGGTKEEEAFYVNDTLDQVRKIYYPSGELQIEETYSRGQFEGSYKAYYENGQLELEGMYISGSMDGNWKRYYKNGQLLEIVAFKNNEENGPFVEYYENGNLKAEGEYLNGDNEHGLLKMYNENGTLVRKMNCDKGVCRTTWKLEEDS